MKSFERPIDQWKEIERELEAMLVQTDHCRDRFGDIEAKLLNAVRRLGQIDLGSPFDNILPGDIRRMTPVPQTEVLDVSIRHTLGHSLSGHQEARQRVSDEYENIELSSNLLKDLHKSILSADLPSGQFRDKPSYFPEFDAEGNWISSNLTIPPGDVPAYLDRLHDRFHALMHSNSVHPLLPIAGYTADLFRIHPFPDGNGRLTRLALLLLLHKSGYHIGRYISIEGAINTRRLDYLTAIRKTSSGWLAGRHDLRPWCTFVVALIRDAYRELSVRTAALDTASGHFFSIVQAIGNMRPHFTTAELMSHLPDVPVPLARIVLNRMRRQGKLSATLSDMTVEWRKANPAAPSPGS